MRADCRSGIQSSAELNGFWETGIVEEMCFNKIRFAWALAAYLGVVFSAANSAARLPTPVF